MKQKIDFAQNINALGAPKGFEKVIAKNAQSFLNYPDLKNNGVNTSLAQFTGVKENTISYVNGSTEAFFNLPNLLKQKQILVVQPTFWEYEVANKKAHKNIKVFLLDEKDEFKLDLQKLGKAVTSDSVVYLCNPNNPTSTLFDKTLFTEFVKSHSDCVFVVDETYLIFRHDYKKLTLTKGAQNLKNLYIVSSLSKIFALPGIRAGFIVSSPENISGYIISQIPYDLSPLNSLLTQWLLKQEKYLERTREYYKKARVLFTKDIKDKLNGRIKIINSEANFILAKILTDQSSTDVVKALSSQGILIRDGKELPYLGEKWIRFTIKTITLNKLLVSKLDKILTNE